ncbi:cytochrome p450 [Trifolium pratense]|uniref:Cytochrome p450 n=1 Tax=Trifolium pratense TaxID=57577 RepID=A0A2K3JNA9_TRIPR|nr:cytochrome p450 [Trifolium pratense]
MSNKAGIGMCIKDAHGGFVDARTELIEHILDVMIGKAMGSLRALNWVNEMQITYMNFEMD